MRVEHMFCCDKRMNELASYTERRTAMPLPGFTSDGFQRCTDPSTGPGRRRAEREVDQPRSVWRLAMAMIALRSMLARPTEWLFTPTMLTNHAARGYSHGSNRRPEVTMLTLQRNTVESRCASTM